MEILELLGRLARNRDDLEAATRLAAGKEISAAERRRLQLRGALEGSELRASLIGPLLGAVHWLSPARLLAFLAERFRHSDEPAERDQLLRSLAEELYRQRGDLRRAKEAQADELAAVLRELGQALENIGPEQADPALVTRVAALVAETIEVVAERLGRRPRPRRRKRVGHFSPELLAQAARGTLITLPVPLALPQLARPSMAGDLVKLRTNQALAEEEPSFDLTAALNAEDVCAELFGSVEAEEAFERHFGLAGEDLAAHGLRPGSELREFRAVRASELAR